MQATQIFADRADHAVRWFCHSGIQAPEGGVARYYRDDLGRNARVSTEITGYAVSSLVYLHARTGNREALTAARKAADFLVNTAWDARLNTFPFEVGTSDDPPEPLAYFFDCGIIVRGLLAIHRATGDPSYSAAALRGGLSMTRHFPSQDVIHPIVSLPSFAPLPHAPQWSRSPGCYQLKSAMAWFDLGQLTGEALFTDWYERTLASALSTHNDFLPAPTPESTVDRLHAYSYFLEAVLPAADRPEVREALTAGIDRVAGYLRELRPRFERSDAYAQLLRVRLLASQLADIPLDTEAAEEELSAIPGFQLHDSADERRNGGYSFGRKAGELIPHVNPVSTAFCSQALEMWQDVQSGRQLELASLV